MIGIYSYDYSQIAYDPCTLEKTFLEICVFPHIPIDIELASPIQKY